MVKKQVEEIRNESLEDEINFHDDDDENDGDPSEENINSRLEELHRLREEDDILRCQVEALKNELNEMCAAHAADMERRNRLLSDLLSIKRVLDISKNTLLGLHQKRSVKDEESDSKSFSAPKKRKEGNTDSTDDQVTAASTSSFTNNVEKEAHMISLISIFLHILPLGASADFICAYLHQWDSTITAQDVENVMKKHPSIFKKNLASDDGNSSENWSFISFQK